ncbi:swr1 complex component, partial [Ceratobasidium sp. 370]
MSDDEHLHRRRAELLEERKRELDAVVDRHDSVLRELFHLQKFLTFFGFDPQVAKQEKSEVWDDFRKPYDLWENHAPLGPSSRRTRRAINERRESLIPGTASTSTPASARKGKPPDVERALRRASISNPNLDAALDSPVAEHKGKGKGKAFAHPATPARLKKRPLPTEDEGESRGAPTPDEDEKLADGVAALAVSTPGPSPRQKHKRKPSPAPPDTPSAPPPDSPSESPTTTPLPKRIRLIVKPPPPPPIATHPAQLPRPRSFGGSLERLLSSFALLEEGDEDDLPEPPSRGQGQMIRPGEEKVGEKQKPVKIGMSWEEFAQSVQSEVEVWGRIEEMKRQGGLRCMRGWEIVRGEEDGSEEGEEEAEGEEETGGEGEAVNEGQEGEVEGPEGGITPETAAPAVASLELVASPGAMEIDATDLDPTTPVELAPPKAPGTSPMPESTKAVEPSGIDAIERSSVDGAGSSLGLEIPLSGVQQTPPESVDLTPAPLVKEEFTPGVEPTAAVDP